MSDFNELVRTEAYLIWQSEGCPAGQHDHHWVLAMDRVRARTLPVKAPVIPLPLKRIVLSARVKRKPGEQEWTRVSA